MTKMKMTSARKEAFLESLAKHGLVTVAARDASPHSKGGCAQSFKDERERDPDFAADWLTALEIADEVTIAEIRRRGIEGYERAVWGSGGTGMGTVEVGKETHYSDKMAELFARIQSLRVRQALTNKTEVAVSGKLETGMDLRDLSPEKRALLEQLLEPEDGPSE